MPFVPFRSITDSRVGLLLYNIRITHAFVSVSYPLVSIPPCSFSPSLPLFRSSSAPPSHVSLSLSPACLPPCLPASQVHTPHVRAGVRRERVGRPAVRVRPRENDGPRPDGRLLVDLGGGAVQNGGDVVRASRQVRREHAVHHAPDGAHPRKAGTGLHSEAFLFAALTSYFVTRSSCCRPTVDRLALLRMLETSLRFFSKQNNVCAIYFFSRLLSSLSLSGRFFFFRCREHRLKH